MKHAQGATAPERIHLMNSTLEELAKEKEYLMRMRDKLQGLQYDIDVDIAIIEQEADELLNKMEKELKNG